MSLSKLRKITDEGVAFQSHIDGSPHMLTPERAVEIQCLLGSDIQMQLDECVALPAAPRRRERAVDRSLAWAERCQARVRAPAGARAARPGQALFGIVQGGIDPDLRAALRRRAGGDGFSRATRIGGLAVGEPQQPMLDTLDADRAAACPRDKPRYLMGVGTPLDLIEAWRAAPTCSTACMPTRSGRHGQAFTWAGKVNLKNARHADDPGPARSGEQLPRRARLLAAPTCITS